MKYLIAIALLFIVNMSTAMLPDNIVYSKASDTNQGDQAFRPFLSVGLGAVGTAVSSTGRYISYVTDHVNLSDPLLLDQIVHRYDRIEKTTLSSTPISNDAVGLFESFYMSFDNANGDSIVFSNFNKNGSSTSYRYDFITRILSPYKSGIEKILSVSPSGRFLIYSRNEINYTFDNEKNIEKIVPINYEATNGNKIIYRDSPGTFGRKINDRGDMILKVDYETGTVENTSKFYQYNAETEKFMSIKDMIPEFYDINIFNEVSWQEGASALISNDGKYITLPAKNAEGDLLILLIDTELLSVIDYEVNFKMLEKDEFLPRLVTNAGLVQYVHYWEGVDSNDSYGKTELFLYDFHSKKILERSQVGIEAELFKINLSFLDMISLDGDYVIRQDFIGLGRNDNSPPKVIESRLYWSGMPVGDGNEARITPTHLVIDPYSNKASQFSVDVSGTDIYGLDVNCNLSSESLSITQANYNGLFGSQNTMTLPLIYSASAITATETLVAPELAFTGAGSFVLADVIAEFTTEDVQVICAAEVSDKNGQLLQVTLTPATIRIDDGVHGGAGSVSGVIEILGVADLSGVEVVLTIDGRQVTVITDESGHFEFDGLRDGEFTISLASENYVQSCQVANVAAGGVVDLGSIELLAGDINVDGSIDIADFTFMAARYRSNQGDADYATKADLNKDDTINIQDLAILGSHFGSAQCNPL